MVLSVDKVGKNQHMYVFCITSLYCKVSGSLGQVLYMHVHRNHMVWVDAVYPQ